jgi:hypothetical protein
MTAFSNEFTKNMLYKVTIVFGLITYQKQSYTKCNSETVTLMINSVCHLTAGEIPNLIVRMEIVVGVAEGILD